MVAFYAAGVGVMFLLFSCSARAAARCSRRWSRERSSALLSTPLGMGRPARGQVAVPSRSRASCSSRVMFAWGALVFGLELCPTCLASLVMTLATAGAAAGFGLVLATLRAARARQLCGIATIVILMMSALGGSMFPRFLMSETMQKLGLLTFNALGARRLHQGVLAQRPARGALAAAAGARAADGRFS